MFIYKFMTIEKGQDGQIKKNLLLEKQKLKILSPALQLVQMESNSLVI